MNPQAINAQNIADSAVIDEKIADILNKHGLDNMGRDQIADTLATMSSRDYLAITAEINQYRYDNPDARRDSEVLIALVDLTRNEWRKRINPVREQADKGARAEVEAARRAIAARDEEAFQKSFALIQQRSNEIGDAVRAAQNSVRQEMRNFLERSGLGAGEIRNTLVEEHSRALTVPDSVASYMAAPAALEAEQVRAAQRDQQAEQERRPRPQNSPAPSPSV